MMQQGLGGNRRRPSVDVYDVEGKVSAFGLVIGMD
jgi:hypothetical protein